MQGENISVFVSALKKSYQSKKVLKDVNFSVPGGSIFALLGSNGAGKTTIIRILTTQIDAECGEIKIEGYDYKRNARQVREIISLTGQFSAIDESLTGKENLIIMGKLRHVSKPQKSALELLKYFDLSDSQF